MAQTSLSVTGPRWLSAPVVGLAASARAAGGSAARPRAPGQPALGAASRLCPAGRRNSRSSRETNEEREWAGLATRSCQLSGGAAGRWVGARRWVGGLFSSRAVTMLLRPASCASLSPCLSRPPLELGNMQRERRATWQRKTNKGGGGSIND